MIITQWLISEGYAKAQRHAQNIIVLLELGSMHNNGYSDDEIKERVRLYYKWRKSGMYDEKDREICAQMAISGVDVPTTAVPMFPEAPVQNPFGELEETASSDDTGDCKHGIPKIFCAECSSLKKYIKEG